ncbi:hypothetical protein DFH06DRAFT_1153056 [Mycena polygramma]|nr:hypothetical protein DFH06DRAFT_1153056 [Mycena polygramma]
MTGTRFGVSSVYPNISPIMKIPVELSCIIFEEACTPCPDVPIILYCEVYNLRCAKLRHTHPAWRDIIERNPSFWTKLHIDCFTRPEQIMLHLAFIGNLPMDVTVHFSVHSSQYLQYLDGPPSDFVPSPEPIAASSTSDSDGEDGADSSSDTTASGGSSDASHDSDNSSTSTDLAVVREPRHPTGFDYASHVEMARSCLQAALPSVDRWMRVCLWTTVDVFLVAMLDVLGPVPGPDVKYLIFGCPTEDMTMTEERSCTSILSNPRPIFGAFLPIVETMHLVGIPVPFVAPNITGLRCLCICDLPPDLCQLVPELIASLVAIPYLKELVIGGGAVYFPRGTELASRFDMPDLEVITILGDVFSEPVIRFLLAMESPRLRNARFYNFSLSDWATAMQMVALQTLEKISVYGDPGTSLHARVFLSRLHNIVSARFDCTSDYYTRELARSPGLCPSMRHLIIGPADVHLLIKFVAARQRQEDLRIQGITFHHEYDLPISLPVYDLLCVLRLYVPDLVTYPDVL